MFVSSYILRPDDPRSHLAMLALEESENRSAPWNLRTLVQDDPPVAVLDIPSLLVGEASRSAHHLVEQHAADRLPEGVGVLAIPVASDDRFEISRRTMRLTVPANERINDALVQLTPQLSDGERLLGPVGYKNVESHWRRIESRPLDEQGPPPSLVQRHLVAIADSSGLQFLSDIRLGELGAQPYPDGLPGYPTANEAHEAARAITSHPEVLTDEEVRASQQRAREGGGRSAYTGAAYVLAAMIDPRSPTPGFQADPRVEKSSAEDSTLRDYEHQRREAGRVMTRVVSLATRPECYETVYEVEYVVARPLLDETPVDGYLAVRIDITEPEDPDSAAWPVPVTLWNQPRATWPRSPFPLLGDRT